MLGLPITVLSRYKNGAVLPNLARAKQISSIILDAFYGRETTEEIMGLSQPL